MNLLNRVFSRKPNRNDFLAGIKLLHTAIPFAGARRPFRWAAVPTRLVLVECTVLAVNRCRCPLTGLADRYTEERTNSFDICLPL